LRGSPERSEFLTQDYDLELVEVARAVRERAYAPYSGFKVGAALRTKSGKILLGCNVENVSYGLSICAERSAALAAVAAGELEWEAIAVVADTAQPTTPCGACRQFLAEFNPTLRIIVANLQQVQTSYSLAELLPYAFDRQTYCS
jgi:cytidine deaminase